MGGCLASSASSPAHAGESRGSTSKRKSAPPPAAISANEQDSTSLAPAPPGPTPTPPAGDDPPAAVAPEIEVRVASVEAKDSSEPPTERKYVPIMFPPFSRPSYEARWTPSASPVVAAAGDVPLTVVSFNVLSQFNLDNAFRNRDGRYDYAGSEVIDWTARSQALFAVLRGLAASTARGVDVFALQEVDFGLHQSEIAPFMKTLGYVGVHQWDKASAKASSASSSPHPWGTATYVAEARFKVAFKEARSRALVLGLTPRDRGHEVPEIFVVNFHLAADSEKTSERLSQLCSTLWKMSLHAKVDPAAACVVSCGDFNSLRTDAPFRWLLEGKLPDSSDTHAFNFQDAYEGFDSTRDLATFVDPFQRARVDLVAFTPGRATVAEALLVPDEPRMSPVFGSWFPSDHFPVGVSLSVRPAEPRAPAADEDACPLTEGQFRVLRFLEANAPAKPKGSGKPPESFLRAAKAHAASIQVFSTHLSAAQKQWVTKWRKQQASAKAPPPAPEPPPKRRRGTLQTYMTLGSLGLSELFDSPSKRAGNPEQENEANLKLRQMRSKSFVAPRKRDSSSGWKL